MASDEQLCLRWNQRENDLATTFQSLLDNGTLLDCTLAAEGRYLQAHKVVLSACSPYFARLLKDHYDKYPILILRDVQYEELKHLVDFVYRGEVNIAREKLRSFLKTAESLQIRGLADNNQYEEVNRASIRHCGSLISQQPRPSPQSRESPKQPLKNFVESSPAVVTEATATTAAVSVLNSKTFKPSSEKLKKETSINSSSTSRASPHNDIKASNVIPSQAPSTLAIKSEAEVPFTSTGPKIESSHMSHTAICPVICDQVPHIVSSTSNTTGAHLLAYGWIKSEKVKNELFHECVTIEESDAESDQNSHLATATGLPNHANQTGSNKLVLNNDSKMDVDAVESSQNICPEPDDGLAILDNEELDNGSFPSIGSIAEPAEPINLSLKKEMLGKKYPCGVSGCEERFIKAYERRYHEEKEHGFYRCSKCPKTFNSKSKINYHARCHEARKIFTKKKPWSRKKTKTTARKNEYIHKIL